MKTMIGVIGGGLMGLGIASVFCRHGHGVRMYEADAARREALHAKLRQLLRDDGHDPELARGLQVVDRLEALGRDLAIVFEAGPEKLPVKQAIFAALAEHTSESTILASNTSVLPITDIAEGAPLAARRRIIGTHWWNPANLIPLVEVVRTKYADDAMLQEAHALLGSVGKQPVYVEKDITGFIGNRLQHALWREAHALISAGACSPETIDLVVKNSFGLRLPEFGPIENADMVGLDLTLDIHRVVLRELSNASQPLPALEERVARGELGAKANQGFLAWNEDKKRQVQARLNRHIRNILDSREAMQHEE